MAKPSWHKSLSVEPKIKKSAVKTHWQCKIFDKFKPERYDGSVKYMLQHFFFWVLVLLEKNRTRPLVGCPLNSTPWQCLANNRYN